MSEFMQKKMNGKQIYDEAHINKRQPLNNRLLITWDRHIHVKNVLLHTKYVVRLDMLDMKK